MDENNSGAFDQEEYVYLNVEYYAKIIKDELHAKAMNDLNRRMVYEFDSIFGENHE